MRSAGATLRNRLRDTTAHKTCRTYSHGNAAMFAEHSPRRRPHAGAAAPTPPPPDTPAPAPLVAPAGFLAAPSEVTVPAGAALVGPAVLYLWPAEGWVRGTVAHRSRAAGFLRLVRYGSTSALGSDVTPSRRRLDAASHGPTRIGLALGAPCSHLEPWVTAI